MTKTDDDEKAFEKEWEKHKKEEWDFKPSERSYEHEYDADYKDISKKFFLAGRRSQLTRLRELFKPLFEAYKKYERLRKLYIERGTDNDDARFFDQLDTLEAEIEKVERKLRELEEAKK